MNWLEEFHARLIKDFDWTPPISSQELEARLTSGAFFLPVPDILWAYASGHHQFGDGDDESPWENMRGNLNHQGSVTPQTALAIPFVLQIARHLPDAPQIELLSEALWYGTGYQEFHLPWGWPIYEEEEKSGDDPYFGIACYYALKHQASVIREIAMSKSFHVKAMALWTLSFIPHNAENVAFTRAMWNHEDAAMRRLAMLSLAKLGVEMTPDEWQTLESGLTSDDENLRVVCAMALATAQLLKEQSPSDIVLKEICDVYNYSEERTRDIFKFEIAIEPDSIAYNIYELWGEEEPERVKAMDAGW